MDIDSSQVLVIVLCVALFTVAFIIGDINGERRESKPVLVSGETWDHCDSPDLIIHPDGHGVKMIHCWKDVVVDLKGVK